MADAVWPVGLPQAPLVRKSNHSPTSATIRSSVDAGPDKVRRRSTIVIDKWSLGLIVSGAQLTTFKTFFHSTCQSGAIAFDWKDPHTGAEREFRFVGEYRVNPLMSRLVGGTEKWELDFDVEALPIAAAGPPPPPPPPTPDEARSMFEDPPTEDGTGREVIAGWDDLLDAAPVEDEPPRVSVFELGPENDAGDPISGSDTGGGIGSTTAPDSTPVAVIDGGGS